MKFLIALTSISLISSTGLCGDHHQALMEVRQIAKDQKNQADKQKKQKELAEKAKELEAFKNRTADTAEPRQ